MAYLNNFWFGLTNMVNQLLYVTIEVQDSEMLYPPINKYVQENFTGVSKFKRVRGVGRYPMQMDRGYAPNSDLLEIDLIPRKLQHAKSPACGHITHMSYRNGDSL